jgi:DNA repair photolyase
MFEARPDRPHKGRGAVSNRSGRYEAYQHVATFDGWEHGAGAEDEARPAIPATSVARDSSRRVIARNQSPDVPFDRSINPYRGCEHGCIYCFARPTHAWLGLSPGLDFETKLFAKPDAAELLRAELANPRYRPATLALGTATDPYQPVERRLEITRALLAVLLETRHPVAIVTKSPLVTRDLDLLAAMAKMGVVRVLLSLTTLDGELARRLEPRAAAPQRRLAAIAALAQAGVPVGVLAAPMIPALNDAELERILEAAAGVGARTAGYVLLRLPLEIKELFEEWLEAHYPERKARVLKLVRETRGGKLYESGWGLRMRGRGVYAELLEKRFRAACRRSGLERGEWALDESRFRRPAPAADPAQMSLF